MPAKRKKQKRTKRKTTKLSLSSYGSLGGFPDVKKARFRYCQEVQLDCAASAFDEAIYRANGVSDPDEAVGGHSPMGYLVHKALYGQVIVDYCVMKVEYMANGSTSNVVPSYFGILLSDTAGGTTGFSNITDVYENKNSTNPMRCGIGSRDKQVITKIYNGAKYSNKSPYSNNDFGSAVAATPEIDSYFTLYTASINSSNGGPVNFLVTLDYYCTFSERKLESRNA